MVEYFTYENFILVLCLVVPTAAIISVIFEK